MLCSSFWGVVVKMFVVIYGVEVGFLYYWMNDVMFVWVISLIVEWWVGGMLVYYGRVFFRCLIVIEVMLLEIWCS